MTEIKSPSKEMAVLHYGVKGMHWGVRKAETSSGGSAPAKKIKAKDLPQHKNYKARNLVADKQTFGQRGVNRINKRMHKGQSYKKALTMEYLRNTAKATIGAGASVVATLLVTHGDVLSQAVAVKAETNRGRAHLAATMGLPSKPTNGPTYAKKSRGGAHKITTL